MNKEQYSKAKTDVITAGFGWEIERIEELIRQTPSISDFVSQYIYVVINSGMKNEIANKIFKKVIGALQVGIPAGDVFGHKGKTKAIGMVVEKQHELYLSFMESDNKLEFLETLPWIGPITKYHLARNLGVDVAKPDIHLSRLAKRLNTTTHELCGRLSKESGDLVGVVDYVLWRASKLRLLDSIGN